MAKFIKVESEDLTFEIFPSARVPLVYRSKFGVGLLKDAENVLMEFDRSAFLIHQCYLAKCKNTGEKPEITEDQILDSLPATMLVRHVIKIIKSFTDEIEDMNPPKPESDTEKKT